MGFPKWFEIMAAKPVFNDERGGKMKKVILLIAIGAGLFMAAQAQSITVISPVAGSAWFTGTTCAITWTSTGVSGPLSIKLRQANAPDAPPVLEIVASTENDGTFSWPVPATLAPGSYLVRVRTVADSPLVYDDSGAFSIATQPATSITVMAPAVGNEWQAGTTHTITWNSAGVSGQVAIYLRQPVGQDLPPVREISAGTANNGSFSWAIPADVPPGSYVVRVRGMAGNFVVFGDSWVFTIAPFQLAYVPELRPELGRLAIMRPDLVVCLRWHGGNPMIYHDKRVKVWVKNVGTVDAPASTLKVYVEGKGDHIATVPVLAPNAQFYWTKKFDWGTCGHKTVRATADIHGVVNELNEGNNVLEGRVEVDCGFSPYSLEMMRCSDGSEAPQ
jgi:hypothetical protein